MNRFDFLGDPRRERVHGLLAEFVRGKRRRALVAACTVVAAFVVSFVGIDARSAALDGEIDRDAALRNANAPAIARYRTIARDVAGLDAMHADIVAARQSARLRARDLVALSDRLPAGVWLSSLHAGAGVGDWHMIGEARTVVDVAATLLAAQRDRRTRSAALESVREEPGFGVVSYAIGVHRK